MAETDNWGADPQVRYLRRIFSRIEEMQAALLTRLGVGSSDYRLRRVRESTLKLFEQGWMLAQRNGVVGSDEEIAVLYLYCFARMLGANRIPVAPEELPAHDGIAAFVKEVLK